MFYLLSSHTLNSSRVRSGYFTVLTDASGVVKLSVNRAGLELSTYAVNVTANTPKIITYEVHKSNEVFTINGTHEVTSETDNITITIAPEIKNYINIGSIFEHLKTAVSNIQPTDKPNVKFREAKNIRSEEDISPSMERQFFVDLLEVSESDIFQASRGVFELSIIYPANVIYADIDLVSKQLLEHTLFTGVCGLSVDSVQRIDLTSAVLIVFNITVDYYSTY